MLGSTASHDKVHDKAVHALCKLAHVTSNPKLEANQLGEPTRAKRQATMKRKRSEEQRACPSTQPESSGKNLLRRLLEQHEASAKFPRPAPVVVKSQSPLAFPSPTKRKLSHQSKPRPSQQEHQLQHQQQVVFDYATSNTKPVQVRASAQSDVQSAARGTAAYVPGYAVQQVAALSPAARHPSTSTLSPREAMPQSPGLSPGRNPVAVSSPGPAPQQIYYGNNTPQGHYIVVQLPAGQAILQQPLHQPQRQPQQTHVQQHGSAFLPQPYGCVQVTHPQQQQQHTQTVRLQAHNVAVAPEYEVLRNPHPQYVVDPTQHHRPQHQHQHQQQYPQVAYYMPSSSGGQSEIRYITTTAANMLSHEPNQATYFHPGVIPTQLSNGHHQPLHSRPQEVLYNLGSHPKKQEQVLPPQPVPTTSFVNLGGTISGVPVNPGIKSA